MARLWEDDPEVVEFPSDPAGLAAAVSWLGRMTAGVARAVGEFDADAQWAESGSTSALAWLRHQGMDRGDAFRMARVGRQMTYASELADLAVTGELNAGQVRAVSAPWSARLLPRMADTAADVLPLLVGLTVEETAAAVAVWVQRAEADDDGPAPRHRPHQLRLSPTLDDRYFIDGNLDALGGATLERALGLADSGDLDTPATERRADALVTVARYFLDHQTIRPAGRHRPHVNVTVDFDSWHTGHPHGYVTDTGMRVPSDVLAALLCDCAVHRVVAGGTSSILDYGTATRTINPALWNAVVLRDRHCRWPGCDRPPTWCDAHHVIEVANHCPTNLANLLLLCGTHHRFLHRNHWHAHLAADAVFTVTAPNGTTQTSRPPPHAADLLDGRPPRHPEAVLAT